jgi:DNA phosphorothioation-associated putative methyltransferase
MTTVARHKTAITRYQLSAPMQALARAGLIDGGRRVFDYGCGHGHDLEVLRAAGIAARGWDPYYLPDAPREPADVVNLGYVLNVIEDPKERVETARQAFALARTCLAVAVMITGKYDVSGMRPHGDGYLSNRGTFQRYFAQGEIKRLLEDALDNEAIAVAPGLFFVFRDKIEEQRFLAERARRARDISGMLLPRERPERVSVTQARIAAHRDTLAALWQRTLELGRHPHEDELDEELVSGIRSGLGTMGRALPLARQLFDPAGLEAARAARTDDLRLYFALNLFNRRRPYRTLPPELQRDVKAFLGSYKAAEAAGRELLFSLGDPDIISTACQAAAAAGLGQLHDEHALQLHGALIDRLPGPLRAYVGCAEKLYGSVRDADLIKIHIRSGKLTLLRYEDFDNDPLPRLVERIKIDMRAQDIAFFDHRDRPQLLYLKSRYLAPDHPAYARQKAFDEALLGLGLFDLSGFGPDPETFHAALAGAGYEIHGSALVARRRNS